MSQHRITINVNGKNLSVLMGWDRPLQGFFCVVSLESASEDKIIYSNLEDPHLVSFTGLSPDIEYFYGKLHALDIEIPELMIFEIIEDCIADRGNRYVLYSETGKILQDV